MDDETARSQISRVIDLEIADLTVIGWKQVLVHEADLMRREMPYADRLEIRLVCDRRQDG